MESTRKNIFVFGSDEFNLSLMRSLDTQNRYKLHSLYHYSEIKAGEEFPVRELYEGAQEKLRNFRGTVDGIVGYWDFPVSTLLPLLRKPYDLASPSLESVLKCEHKYWSRLEQRRVIPDFIPDFCAVDPFADDYRQQITLDYPFWIKPIKSASSYLGFKVRNDSELDHAIQRIRDGIARYGNPFNYVLQFAQLPDKVARIHGNWCLAEQIISKGRQCTLEGYVYDGEVTVYGIVDSIREGKHRSSFSRYQYPSSIPRRVQQQMISVIDRFLRHIDFDNGPFNAEFYWSSSDRISLLEVNTRISKSHCPLFQKVDGHAHHKVMVELALGEKPDFPARQGQFRIAAKFMWRTYENAIVKKVPDARSLAKLKEQFPESDIELHIEPGMKLSSLADQDSYSYEIAVIFLGAQSQQELLQKYRDIQGLMDIELEPLSGKT
ncbi:acetyl-CoA carboxylase biotin carboxylase subunit family protein [Marinobacter sp.]|uniref:ATP-grasp domain-containing protein n=1 Tax=Marinobacter sp. TaxID=50741 RepID=UPI00356AA9F4